MSNNRREFLQSLIAVGASVGLLPLATACGDDGGGGDTGTGGDAGTGGDGGGGCASTTANIGTNHGHELMVPAADVAAGAEMTYDIMGTSTHAHSVTLTADDMMTLQGGGTVTVTSSSGAMHTHEVTVMCG